jgi:hypothetical protein
VRLWVRDDLRKPDPEPARIDDRKIALAGLVLWLVALGVLLAFLDRIATAGAQWTLWTVFAGIGLGIVLLVYTQVRHSRRAAQGAADVTAEDPPTT